MGMMRDFNVSEIDWKQNPIGKHEFYQNYLSKSLPLVLRRAFEHTRFYQEAQQDHEKFLTLLFQNGEGPQSQDQLIDYTLLQADPTENNKFIQGIGLGRNHSGTYPDFLSKKQALKSNQMGFIQDLPLSAMYHKFQKYTLVGDNVIQEIMRPRRKLLTIWKDFNRRPKKIVNEQYICVVKGQERYRIVSPIFRKNIYVGAYPHLRQECPLDFFNFDANKYAFTKQAKFIDVILNAGDCMYVPAFYYIQSKTLTKEGTQESIIFTQEYAPHSQMLDMIFDGLEQEVMVENDETHEWDKKMLNYLHQLY